MFPRMKNLSLGGAVRPAYVRLARKLPYKTIARDICIRNALCLDFSTDFGFHLTHILCRLHCMDVTNIISEHRWKKPLDGSDFFNSFDNIDLDFYL
jgi:hypothetical protein